jgi:hypothetical protein
MGQSVSLSCGIILWDYLIDKKIWLCYNVFMDDSNKLIYEIDNLQWSPYGSIRPIGHDGDYNNKRYVFNGVRHIIREVFSEQGYEVGEIIIREIDTSFKTQFIIYLESAEDQFAWIMTDTDVISERIDDEVESFLDMMALKSI